MLSGTHLSKRQWYDVQFRRLTADPLRASEWSLSEQIKKAVFARFVADAMKGWAVKTARFFAA